MNVGEKNPEPSVSLETITPEQATKWLSRNENNRNLREAVVNRYARDLLQDGWSLTGDPIQFSGNGRLLDGQHRLSAIVQAKTTAQLFVARGLSEGAQQYMDQGVARTAGDALGLVGHANPALMASAARLAVQVETGVLFGDRKLQSVSHAQILDWLSEHPEMGDCAKFVGMAPQRDSSLSPTVSAYSYYLFSGIHADDAWDFFNRLGSGAGLELGSPLLALNKKINSIASKQQRLGRREVLWMVCRAWNAYRTDAALHRILIPSRISHLPELV